MSRSPEIALASGAMMLLLSGTVALGFIQNGRYIRPITQFGMGSMLAGIIGVSMHIGYVNPISTSVPILLVLSSIYVLGIRPALFWTFASIAGMGISVWAQELPIVPDVAMPASKLGTFYFSAMVQIAVFALSATERHFSDQRRAELDFLARHDSLTGLLNRRSLEDDLREAWAPASGSRCSRMRGKTPVC